MDYECSSNPLLNENRQLHSEKVLLPEQITNNFKRPALTTGSTLSGPETFFRSAFPDYFECVLPKWNSRIEFDVDPGCYFPRLRLLASESLHNRASLTNKGCCAGKSACGELLWFCPRNCKVQRSWAWRSLPSLLNSPCLDTFDL